MKQYICIDIGGTEIKYGIMDETELFLAKDKTPTEASKGGPCLLEKAAGIVREYLKVWKADGIGAVPDRGNRDWGLHPH